MPKIYGCVIFSAAPFSFQSAYDNMAEVFDQYRFNLELEIKLGRSKSEEKSNGYKACPVLDEVEKNISFCPLWRLKYH